MAKSHSPGSTDTTRTIAVRRWSAPTMLGVGLGVGGVALIAILFLFDPARHSFYPICLFKRLTGYDCPGCGGLRAFHELLHGEFWRAFQLNALLVISIPVTAIWTGLAALRTRRTGARPSGGRRALFWAWLVVVAILCFGLLRNLPLWPFAVTPM